MEMEAMKFVGVGLLALGMLGAAIGVGLIFGNAAQGIARNPASAAAVKGTAILGAVLAEFMGLLSFVLAIIIMFVV